MSLSIKADVGHIDTAELHRGYQTAATLVPGRAPVSNSNAGGYSSVWKSFRRPRRSGRVAREDGGVTNTIERTVPDATRGTTAVRRLERDTSQRESTSFTCDVAVVSDHDDALLAMRDRVTGRVDYEGPLGRMGDRGRRAPDAIGELETAVEAGRARHVVLVASACYGPSGRYPLAVEDE